MSRARAQQALAPESGQEPKPELKTSSAPALPAASAEATKPANPPAAPTAAEQKITIPKPPPAIDPMTGIPLYETIQEDWSSLQIGTSKLVPEPPLPAQVEVQEKFTRALVSVKWRPGDAIDLWIVLPKGVKNPPAVLYLYNFTEDTARFRDNDWCLRTTKGGVAAVGFVSALSGPRFHDRPMKQWFLSEMEESVASTVHDVQLILDYLAQRGDVDMNRIGMFGEGSGGAIAILAAAADPRIKAVDALDPWGDWPDFLDESPYVKDSPHHKDFVAPEFLKKVAPLDPVKYLPQLTIPIRVQQVRENEAVPEKSKETIKAAIPKQAELVRFVTVNGLAQNESEGRLFNWIKEKLQEIGKPKPGGTPNVAATQSSASQAATAPAR